MSRSLPIVSSRSCRGCVKCCEGWLEADIKGHKMSPGKPCHYLSKDPLGCSDYASRPVEPCVRYRCVWLDDESLSSELSPSKSNLIITRREEVALGDDGMKREVYHEVVVAGESPPGVHDLLNEWVRSNGIKLQYLEMVDGRWYTYTTSPTDLK